MAKRLVLITVKSIVVDQNHIGSLKSLVDFGRLQKVSQTDANISTWKLPSPAVKTYIGQLQYASMLHLYDNCLPHSRGILLQLQFGELAGSLHDLNSMSLAGGLSSDLQYHIANTTAHVNEDTLGIDIGPLNELLDQNRVDLAVHMVGESCKLNPVNPMLLLLTLFTNTHLGSYSKLRHAGRRFDYTLGTKYDTPVRRWDGLSLHWRPFDRLA